MTRQGTNLRRRLAGAAVALTAALPVLFALGPATAGAAVPRDFWGVVPQTQLGTQDFNRMGQGKVGTVRIGVFWTDIDPTADPADFNWATVDPLIRGAADNGVKVLPYLFGTPKWVAQSLDNHHCSKAKCAVLPPKSAAALDAWKSFVGAFLDRYGQQGTFWDGEYAPPKVPIDVVQAWNEQNSSKFFAPKANPKQYAKLLKATAEAVHDHDPSVEIVLGGMAELAGAKAALAGSKYLAKLYKVKGVKDAFDGVAIHPYGASVNKVASQVSLFHDVMKHARDSKAGLWVTEIGAGSASGGNPLNRGTKGQANLLSDTFKYFKKKRNKLNVENVDWFSWMDSTTSICAWCKTSGLFKAGLKPKPSWRAFTKFTGGS